MALTDKEFNIFGWKITKKIGDPRDKVVDKNYETIAPEQTNDGATHIVDAGGLTGEYVNLDAGYGASDRDLILKYRGASNFPEVDLAINHIVNGAISSGLEGAPVKLDMQNNVDLSDDIKEKINDEFDKVLRLFKFNRRAEEYFRDWYIDGRIYFHVIVNDKKLSEGIKELRLLDPLSIKKVKEIKKEKLGEGNKQFERLKVIDEYFLYSDSNTISSQVAQRGVTQSLKIAKDAIVSATSGKTDETNMRIISHLHKALKAINNLKMLEDALVVYRIVRAPERRIFYIDTGNLPKTKAEQHVQSLMAKYRNKLVYDANSGEIKDDARHMSMLEDFWLPRTEGGRGTEVTTLGAGQSLGDIEDVIYFQRKMFKSLNIPTSRLEAENAFSVGRASEITRDEVNFQRYINNIRKNFSFILIDALRIQLLLKKVITRQEWSKLEEQISIDFIEDNYFSELKETEVLRERLEMIQSIEEYTGKYFSDNWVRKNILRQSDGEIEQMNKEIEQEKKDKGDDEDDDF
jgi:hypothetical protein